MGGLARLLCCEVPMRLDRLTCLLLLCLPLAPAHAAAPPPAARLDRHGDPLPAGAVARIGTVRWRYPGIVHALAFCRGDKAVLSAGADGLRLWDVATGRPLRRFGEGSFDQVAVSPDDRLVAAVSRAGSLSVWELSSGKRLQTLQDSYPWSAPAFSPDGRILALPGRAAIWLWAVPTGKELRPLADSKGARDLAFTSDGRTLAALAGPDILCWWDVATGRRVRSVSLSGKALSHSLKRSQDGKALATLSAEGQVRLWDASSGKPLGPARQGSVDDRLAFFPDATTLLTWQLEEGGFSLHDLGHDARPICFAAHHASVTCVACSPDGKRLVSADSEGLLCAWDAGSGKPLGPHRLPHAPLFLLAVAPDGKTVVTFSDAVALDVWDPVSGKHLRALDARCSPVEIVFAPDGKTLLASTWTTGVQRWDAHTGELLRPLMLPFDAARDRPRLSPCGRRYVATSKEGVRVLDVATGKEVRRFAGQTSRALLGPSGKVLVLADKMDQFSLWDVATGAQLGTMERDVRQEGTFAFGSDGRPLLLLEAGTPGPAGLPQESVVLLDMAEWRNVAVPLGERNQTRVAFSADGRMLATGGRDRVVRVWEVLTGKQRLELHGHRGAITELAFFADGVRLASASADTTALIWDLTGQAGAGRPALPAVPWEDLAGEDAARAYQVVWALAANPDQGLPLLRARLRPVPEVSPRQLELLLADLGGDFAARTKAEAELRSLGSLAEAALRRALKARPEAEVWLRIEGILAAIERERRSPSAPTRRQARAVEALERMRSPEAREVLVVLARGAERAPLTRFARAALDRLEGGTPVRR